MSLIRLQNCTKCSVSGGGILNGQAQQWVTVHWPTRKLTRNWRDPGSCPVPSECRPNLIKVVDASEASVQGIFLVDAAYWTVHILRSRNVAVSDVSIRNDPLIANTDGIDTDSSTAVDIRNVTILTGDDAIVVKTTQPGLPMQGLLVSKCLLQTRSSAIKIGSETRGNVSALRFEDIEILPSHRGIAFQLRDQGHVSDVEFARIRMVTELYNASWWGAGEPIAITALPRTRQTQLGSISRVTLRDIAAESENGILIAGSPGSLIEDLVLQNVRVRMRKLTAWRGGLQDRRPGYQGVFKSPAYAVFHEYASRLTYNDVEVSWSEDRPEWRGIFGGKAHTIQSLVMNNFTVSDAAEADAAQYPAAATLHQPAQLA